MKNDEKYAVYSISKCTHNKVKKNLWLRLGTGIPQSDGSFSLCLGVLPLPDPKSGFVRLYMRKLLPHEELAHTANENMEASINVELDSIFGIPQEAR